MVGKVAVKEIHDEAHVLVVAALELQPDRSRCEVGGHDVPEVVWSVRRLILQQCLRDRRGRRRNPVAVLPAASQLPVNDLDDIAQSVGLADIAGTIQCLLNFANTLQHVWALEIFRTNLGLFGQLH